MNRRTFLGGLAGAAFAVRDAKPENATIHYLRDFKDSDVVIEREQPGQPHKGKVLAAIQPHNDDVPLFASGTVLKLIKEGYAGILIRMTNDDAAGRGATLAEVILNNERDNFEVGRRLGVKKVFDLSYRNHRLDSESPVEIRERLIFIFRLMKVDTVICYDPYGHYESNPDHYVTAQCVDEACGQCGSRLDYPEHFEAGVQPHSVKEKYYFSRGPQLVNRIVEITSVIDRKVDVNLANVAQGPAGQTGAALRARLAREGKHLPILGDSDDVANRAYIKNFVLADDAELGKRYGLQYAERFTHMRIGVWDTGQSPVDRYIREHEVSN